MTHSGDIEIQPGPIENALKFCLWNLNSVLAHNRIKISPLEAYNSVYNCDILVLGETYLSGDINHNETFIEGFSKSPFCKDDPSRLRKGGVCMYFKENLPIKRCVDLETLCAEGIVIAITLHCKKKILWAFIVHMACHHMNFVLFMQCLELLLDYMHDENAHCIIFTVDFNCRSQQWCLVTLKTRRVLPLMNSLKAII